jgi:hypothetical protein
MTRDREARIAAAAAARAAGRLRAGLAAALPDATVTVEGDGVVLRGRQLRERPALRWPGGVLR